VQSSIRFSKYVTVLIYLVRVTTTKFVAKFYF